MHTYQIVRNQLALKKNDRFKITRNMIFFKPRKVSCIEVGTSHVKSNMAQGVFFTLTGVL